MFRLSSSSTAGLWLSLLRKNTKITFWTIFPPTLPGCLSSTPKVRSVSSLLLALWMLEPVCRAPRSAHPKRKHRVPPRVQTAAGFGFRTFKAPHREESQAARLKARDRASVVEKKKQGRISLKKKQSSFNAPGAVTWSFESGAAVGVPAGWRMLSALSCRLLWGEWVVQHRL